MKNTSTLSPHFAAEKSSGSDTPRKRGIHPGKKPKRSTGTASETNAAFMARTPEQCSAALLPEPPKANQPILQNVADFQVRYLLQDNSSGGDTKIQYVTADNVDIWARVQAVEVCLVLFGTEPIDMPAGSTYTDCDGTAVNLTTLAGARARRLHIMFRNVFQMRSHGLIGAVL